MFPIIRNYELRHHLNFNMVGFLDLLFFVVTADLPHNSQEQHYVS